MIITSFESILGKKLCANLKYSEHINGKQLTDFKINKGKIDTMIIFKKKKPLFRLNTALGFKLLESV